jgi:hypothetical protein
MWSGGEANGSPGVLPPAPAGRAQLVKEMAMSTTSKPKQYVIALNLSQVVALFIVFARHVIQAMTSNSWFPSPPITLASVTSDVDTLETAQAKALTKAKGAAADRNLKRKQVVDDLNVLKGYVLMIASQNLTQAIAIIQSAGMTAKQVTRAAKAFLAAKMGIAPGEVILTAKSAGRGAAYEWSSSSDNGKTWLSAGITTVATITLPGLTVGGVYLFRFRVTNRKGTADWSQTVSFLVH